MNFNTGVLFGELDRWSESLMRMHIFSEFSVRLFRRMSGLDLMKAMEKKSTTTD